MRRTHRHQPSVFAATLAVLLTTLPGIAACGNFSNEDLIFLAALPDRDSVALKVPGADYGQSSSSSNSLTQGLSACTEDDLHCMAGRVSTGINAGVFALLDLVDAIATEQQPTHRSPGLRLWGPVYIAAENLSVRFEIRRTIAGSSDVFEYCLHALRAPADMDLAADLSCDTELDDSGLVRVLHGTFSPAGSDGGARDGSGSLVFDLNLARDAGVGQVTDQGRLEVLYDHSAGQQRIELAIREVVDIQTLLPSSADYVYRREVDGSGAFTFTVNADFVAGSVFSSLEQLQIDAQWDPCEAGRADARISGGDLGSSTEITASQCWDCQAETVFYEDSAAEHPTLGEANACVFAAAGG